MNTRTINQYLVAVFALTGASAVVSVPQASAEDISLNLSGSDTALVQAGDIKVKIDTVGNVNIYKSGIDSIAIYTYDRITLSPADETAPVMRKAGDRLADDTIYVGDNLAALPADAPGVYTWLDGLIYCEDLEANGREDWTLPTKDQLSKLYRKRNVGALDGTFNDRVSDGNNRWYWSAEERDSSGAWFQSFTDGYAKLGLKGWEKSSVRCVRPAPAAP